MKLSSTNEQARTDSYFLKIIEDFIRDFAKYLEISFFFFFLLGGSKAGLYLTCNLSYHILRFCMLTFTYRKLSSA